MPSKSVNSPAAQIVLMTIQDAQTPVTRLEIVERIGGRFTESTVGTAIQLLKAKGLIHTYEMRVNHGHRLAAYKAGPGVNVLYETKQQRLAKVVFNPRPDPAAAWMRNEIPEQA